MYNKLICYGKRPIGKPRRRWKDIKLDLKELGWAWTGFIRFRLETHGVSFGHGNKPSRFINSGAFLDRLIFSTMSSMELLSTSVIMLVIEVIISLASNYCDMPNL
jgi:hypothetical protein